MYTLAQHGWMIRDDIRTGAYLDALDRSVKRGDVVVDIGTGVGIWAIAACRREAARVYALESSDTIEIARALAEAHGFLDRITFIKGMSTDVVLPERADVIVAEIHGILPLSDRSVASLIDARRRFLRPGGTMLPQEETLWATLIEAPASVSNREHPWGASEDGLDLGPLRRVLVNRWTRRDTNPSEFVVEPQRWARLDYRCLNDPNVRGSVTWEIPRPATIHGMAAWFDTTLIDEVGFSTAPGRPELVFGRAFFPWSPPVAVETGDSVSVEIVARLIGSRYVWRWDLTVRDRCGRMSAVRRQSNFFGAAMSPDQIGAFDPDRVPRMTDGLAMEAVILEGLDGDAGVDEISAMLRQRFPTRFSDGGDPLHRIRVVACRYGLRW